MFEWTVNTIYLKVDLSFNRSEWFSVKIALLG